MSSQGGVSLDKVVLQIESSTGKSISDIDKLASSLENLKSSLSKLQVKSLENLASNIDKLATASEKLSSMGENLKNFGNIADSLKPLSTIGDTANFANVIKNLAKLPEVMGKIDSSTLENVGRVSQELASKLQPLANSLSEIAKGYNAISNLARNYNVSIKSITSKSNEQSSVNKVLASSYERLKKVMSTIGKSTVKMFTVGAKTVSTLEKPLTKATSKIKQMGFALLSVRSAFTFVRKAAGEYLNMDTELQKSFTNTWRAMGAQLAPALEYAQQLFHQFVRVIYSVIYALTGIDLIARANEKAMSSWGQSAKDTLGNLQKFDDLNVVEFNTSSSGDDNQLIDMDKIDLSPIQKIVDWVRELKQTIEEALDTGKWRAVGEVFGEGITGAMTFLDNHFDKIYNTSINIAKELASGINGLISATDFGKIALNFSNAIITLKDSVATFISEIEFDKLGEKLTDFAKNMKATDIVQSMVSVPTAILTGVYETFINMDWGLIGDKTGQAVLTGLKSIDDWINTIHFDEIGRKIRDFIINIDWKSILSELWDIFTSALAGIGSLLASLFFGEDFESKTANAWAGFGMIIGGILIATIVPLLLKGLGSLIKEKFLSLLGLDKLGSKATSAGNATKGLDSLLKSVGKATEIIAIFGGLALVISSITDLLKAFAETSMSSGEALKLIGGILGEIAIGFVAMAGASKLLSGDDFLSILAILGGLSAVLLSLSKVLDSCVKLGDNLDSVFGGLNKTLEVLTVFMGVMVASALLLGSNPLYLIGILAVAGSLSLVLITMSETLPKIMKAVSDFIVSTAPSIQDILKTIGDLLDKIIKALGETLPPIIDSVGDSFTKIFNGIADVILSVGDTISNILNSVASLVPDVLGSVLNFIRELGPAIETFVDSAIRSVTKLMNFVAQSVSWLINIAIVNPINSLINKINKNAIAEKLGWQIGTLSRVNIEPFVPKLETGTNEIPYEGIYHLHPGEAVVPKKYNPALGNGSTEETNQKLDALIAIMDNLSFTNIVNVGNETLYKKQQQYNKAQNNKYGTINI